MRLILSDMTMLVMFEVYAVSQVMQISCAAGIKSEASQMGI